MTADARQFPVRLTEVRAISMSSSTPRISTTPSSGRPNVTSVPESTTIEARGTAAMPLLVSISVNIIVSCCPNERFTPAACATKMEATARYSVLPSRLKEYPVGNTNETMRLGTPNSIIFLNASGNAASDDVVVNAMMAGSLTALMNRRIGIRASNATGSSTTNTKTINAP